MRVEPQGAEKYFKQARKYLTEMAKADRKFKVVTEQDLLRHCRGWLGASTGPAQVAEVAARAHLGPTVESAPTILAPADDAGSWSVDVDGRSLSIAVSVGREVPSIACQTPGGLPAKPAREFRFDVHEEARS